MAGEPADGTRWHRAQWLAIAVVVAATYGAVALYIQEVSRDGYEWAKVVSLGGLDFRCVLRGRIMRLLRVPPYLRVSYVAVIAIL